MRLLPPLVLSAVPGDRHVRVGGELQAAGVGGKDIIPLAPAGQAMIAHQHPVMFYD
jgi:hypothetical protein